MHMRSLIAAVLVALSLTAPATAPAQGSLTERRLAITKGTTPGKTVVEPAATATGAAGAASGPATAPAAPASGAGRATPARTGLFSRLPPPSGRPLTDARRLDAPDQGIVVKSAEAAASAAR